MGLKTMARESVTDTQPKKVDGRGTERPITPNYLSLCTFGFELRAMSLGVRVASRVTSQDGPYQGTRIHPVPCFSRHVLAAVTVSRNGWRHGLRHRTLRIKSTRIHPVPCFSRHVLTGVTVSRDGWRYGLRHRTVRVENACAKTCEFTFWLPLIRFLSQVVRSNSI